MDFPWLPPSPLQVWAVEPGAAQITWGSIPPGPITVTPSGGARRADPVSVEHPGGPGALTIDGLDAGPVHLAVVTAGGDHTLQAAVPSAPPGEELYRFATVSDLHLGSGNWGFLRTIEDIDPDHPDHYDMRCAANAIAEAIDWGASLVVFKGDVAHHRRARDFGFVGDLVDRFPNVQMLLTFGNHDVDHAHPIDLPSSFGRRQLPVETGVRSHDVPGLRIVVADTTIDGKGHGQIDAVADDIVSAAAEAEHQSLVALHHQFQRFPVPTYWPPGIPSGAGKPFLRRLDAAAPATFVTSGHTHRHRAYRSGSLQLTEVGSTKDWPGTWAGYRVFEGGIFQTVRRTAAREAITWTEHSRRALLGLWAPWSPGSLDDRCVAHRPGRG